MKEEKEKNKEDKPYSFLEKVIKVLQVILLDTYERNNFLFPKNLFPNPTIRDNQNPIEYLLIEVIKLIKRKLSFYRGGIFRFIIIISLYLFISLTIISCINVFQILINFPVRFDKESIDFFLNSFKEYDYLFAGTIVLLATKVTFDRVIQAEDQNINQLKLLDEQIKMNKMMYWEKSVLSQMEKLYNKKHYETFLLPAFQSKSYELHDWLYAKEYAIKSYKELTDFIDLFIRKPFYRIFRLAEKKREILNNWFIYEESNSEELLYYPNKNESMICYIFILINNESSYPNIFEDTIKTYNSILKNYLDNK